MSANKYTRLSRIAVSAKYPATFRARLAVIPEALKDQFTAAQLAAIMDGPMHVSFAAGHESGYRDAK